MSKALASARLPAALRARPQRAGCAARRRSCAALRPCATFNTFLEGWASQHPDDEPRMRSIFQPSYAPPSNNAPGVLDARDALETCSHLHGDAKDACFALFNCEPHQVELYYDVVANLESALELETEPEEEAHHGGCER